MTVTRQLVVACDAPECADDDGYIAIAETHEGARAGAAYAGWTVRKDRDYCPKHLETLSDADVDSWLPVEVRPL